MLDFSSFLTSLEAEHWLMIVGSPGALVVLYFLASFVWPTEPNRSDTTAEDMVQASEAPAAFVPLEIPARGKGAEIYLQSHCGTVVVTMRAGSGEVAQCVVPASISALPLSEFIETQWAALQSTLGDSVGSKGPANSGSSPSPASKDDVVDPSTLSQGPTESRKDYLKRKAAMAQKWKALNA